MTSLLETGFISKSFCLLLGLSVSSARGQVKCCCLIGSIPAETPVRIVCGVVEARHWACELFMSTIVVNEGTDTAIVATKAIVFEKVEVSWSGVISVLCLLTIAKC